MDPNELLGKTIIKDVHGNPHKSKIIEESEEGNDLCQVSDSHCEEILTYNEVMEHVHNKQSCNKCKDIFVPLSLSWITGKERTESLKYL